MIVFRRITRSFVLCLLVSLLLLGQLALVAPPPRAAAQPATETDRTTPVPAMTAAAATPEPRRQPNPPRPAIVPTPNGPRGELPSEGAAPPDPSRPSDVVTVMSFVPFAYGDVFVGDTQGQVHHFSSSGTLQQTLPTTAGGLIAGIAFDRAGDLYAAHWISPGRVSKISGSDGTASTFASGINSHPESIVLDRDGFVYVGASQGDKDILKYNVNGTLVQQYNVAVENHGADWIDLHSDQCTMFYTSEGRLIKRYDVCADTQLANFASLPHAHASTRAVRLLPDNTLLVSDLAEIHRVDANGSVIGTYDVSGENSWYDLAIDVDESSFWATGRNTTTVYRFRVSDGTVLGQFAFSGSPHGLAVYRPMPLPHDAAQGECALYKGCTTDPVDTSSGNYLYRHTDLAIPGRGGGVVFARAYNSRDPRVGPLGPGWTHSYHTRLVDHAPTIQVIHWNGRTDRYQESGSDYLPPPGVFDTLEQVSLPDGTAWLLTRQDQTRLGFDASGKLRFVEDRYGNRSTLTYDANGRLEHVADPAGRGELTFSYNPTSGRLVSVSDWLTPTPRVVQFGYDALGRLETVTDRENQTTTYGCDGTSHRLTTITDANGHVAVTNTYDAQGRVATQKDARGLITGEQTTFDYVENPDGTRTTTVTYPATSFEPTWHRTVAATYDAAGRLIERVSKPTSTETIVEEFAYDIRFNRTAVTDGRGNTTHFCYDVDDAGADITGSDGNLTRRIDPAPSQGANRPVTLYQYDAKNNLIQVVPPKGVNSGTTVDCSTNLSASLDLDYATDFTYDAATQTRLEATTRRSTDPDTSQQVSAVTTFAYTDANNPGMVTTIIPPRGNADPDPNSFATTFTYFPSGSKAGLLASVTDPLGNKTTSDYDAVGRRIAMVDPLGNAAGANPAEHTWQYEYDNEDRLRFTRAPAPTPGGSPLVTEFRYDPVGNRIVVVDANGQVTKYVYDERDALEEVWESPNPWTDPTVAPSPKIVTAYAYDHLGNLARVTRAQDDTTYERVVDYAYDGLNRLRTETQYPSWPSTGTTLVTQYTYDENGNRKTLLDPLGQTTTFGYDALNRLTSVDYEDVNTPDVSYQYDANGNRTQLADGTGTTTSTYDELDRLLSITSPGPTTVGYRYDRDGNRTKVISLDNTAVTYSFDKASRLESLLDWANRTTSYQYFPDGSLKQVAHPNGTIADYAYDNARRLIEVWNQRGSTTITKHTSTLDAVGNRTRVDEVLAQFGPAKGWGANGSGQAPQQVTGLSSITAIAAGGNHRLALDQNGVVYAWGANDQGQLGLGSTFDQNSPTAISGLSGVTAIAAGGSHSLALKNDGTVWAWGDNSSGQLGDGTTTDRSSPVPVSGLANVVAIAAGGGHSLALKTDGTVWAWGRNQEGQLGDGTTTPRTTPVRSGTLTGITAIAAGGFHSLALKSTGTVWVWGSNTEGQLGDGSTIGTSTPIPVPGLGTVVAIAGNLPVSGGFYHSLARTNDGRVWAWGDNGVGQLGDGTTNDRLLPVRVDGLTGVDGVAAGGLHSLALKSDGTVWSWGANHVGQLGRSSADDCGGLACSKAASPVSGLTNVTAIAGGGFVGMALKSDGTVWTWGLTAGGMLGDGTTLDRTSPVGVSTASGLAQVRGVVGGGLHSLGLAADGTVWAWDVNARGQLGDGTTSDRMTPVPVQGGLTHVVAIAAGSNHSLALKRDGTVVEWGANDLGQLGDGTTTDRTTPEEVTGLTDGSGVVGAGFLHSLATKRDGTVVAWGNNAFGQLGNGTTTNSATPVAVTSFGWGNVVAAGGFHSLASTLATTNVTRSYAYDRRYRLTEVDDPSGLTSYSYDPVGNRLTMTRGGTPTSYSYDRADRITAASATSYTVDANGNLVARGSDTFTYDQANRLTSATIGGSTSSYAYDGDGKRTSKTVGSTTTSYVYDANRSLPVVLDDGARKYVWGVGLAYAVDKSTGAIEVFHTDGLGSVRAITDAAGSVVQTYTTDEFGVPTQTQGSSTNPFQYTGEQRDAESGFVYLRARVYDPSIGRFLQRDPLFGALRAPLSLNRFAYAVANPLTFADPSGLAIARILKTDRHGDTDNECFSSGGGTFGGNVIFVTCLNTPTQVVQVAVVRTPAGPQLVTGAVFAKPPRGGSGSGNERRKEILDRIGGNFTHDEAWVRQVLQITKRQFKEAIHIMKERIPGNPDVAVHLPSGDVYDPRSWEPIGNLLDEIQWSNLK